jgi:PEGA domain
MRLLRSFTAFVVIACSTFAVAAPGTWDKVRYNGGPVKTKVDAHDWNNILAVTSQQITLRLNDGQRLDIPAIAVTGLSYGQEAHRRLGTLVVLYGLFHKSRVHYIGVEYTRDGEKRGLLLQGDKDNYRDILLALESATNAPLTVSEKDRDFLPSSLHASTVSDEEEALASPDKPAKQATKAAPGTLSVTANLPAADVYVDNAFSCSTPCKFTVDPGRHTVKVTANAYPVWSRELTVHEGSQIALAAKLEKIGH